MVMTVLDSATAMVNWLQTATDATAIRAKVYGGATYILEAGDLTSSLLMTRLAARQAAAAATPTVLNQVLFITVHDAGEVIQQDLYCQRVIVRIIDNDRGYRNIETTRNLILASFEDDALVLADIGTIGQGVISLVYRSRTGYLQNRDYNAQFEALSFEGLVERENDNGS